MTSGTTSKDLHFKAMNLYEKSLAARFYKEEEKRLSLVRQALELEKAAAMMLLDRFDLEPTRSTVFASAAAMAMQCNEFCVAKQMAHLSLSGKPYPDVADEMRELLEELKSNRERATNGVVRYERDHPIQITLAEDATHRPMHVSLSFTESSNGESAPDEKVRHIPLQVADENFVSMQRTYKDDLSVAFALNIPPDFTDATLHFIFRIVR